MSLRRVLVLLAACAVRLHRGASEDANARQQETGRPAGLAYAGTVNAADQLPPESSWPAPAALRVGASAHEAPTPDSDVALAHVGAPPSSSVNFVSRAADAA